MSEFLLPKSNAIDSENLVTNTSPYRCWGPGAGAKYLTQLAQIPGAEYPGPDTGSQMTQPGARGMGQMTQPGARARGPGARARAKGWLNLKFLNISYGT